MQHESFRNMFRKMLLYFSLSRNIHSISYIYQLITSECFDFNFEINKGILFSVDEFDLLKQLNWQYLSGDL